MRLFLKRSVYSYSVIRKDVPEQGLPLRKETYLTVLVLLCDHISLFVENNTLFGHAPPITINYRLLTILEIFASFCIAISEYYITPAIYIFHFYIFLYFSLLKQDK